MNTRAHKHMNVPQALDALRALDEERKSALALGKKDLAGIAALDANALAEQVRAYRDAGGNMNPRPSDEREVVKDESKVKRAKVKGKKRATVKRIKRS